MAKLSINEMTTYRWSFEEDVTHYVAAGITAIGVWRRKLADFGEEKGVELLAESGLQVSNLLWAGGFTGSDGHTFRESLEDAIEAIQLARELQSPTLVVYTGARGGHTHNHARRLTLEALKNLTQVAEDSGVTLALEPMHQGCSSEWTFLTDLKDTLAVLDAVDSPRLQLAYDVYHFGSSLSLEQLAELTPRIAVVHLGDCRQPPTGEQDRCRLGEGVLPLAEITQTLLRSGFHGFFDIELLGPEIETENYHELIEHSKQTFETLIQTGA